MHLPITILNQLKKKLSVLHKPKCLDICTGSGELLAQIMPVLPGYESFNCIDIAPDYIGFGKNVGRYPSIYLLKGYIFDNKLAYEQFDLVTCLRSLHHFPFGAIASLITTKLKSNGYLLIVEEVVDDNGLSFLRGVWNDIYNYYFSSYHLHYSLLTDLKIKEMFRNFNYEELYHSNFTDQSIPLLLEAKPNLDSNFMNELFEISQKEILTKSPYKNEYFRTFCVIIFRRKEN